ncbi:MAG: AroM family protein [Anaerolineae bacterium]
MPGSPILRPSSGQERVLGLVTIGQSPRDDVVSQMLPLLPAVLDIRQVGALDGLTPEQIAELAPGPQDYVLHTRLQDGSAATVGRERITALLQDCLKQLQGEGANPIVLLCTGEFPGLRSDALLIEPDRLLVNVVRGLRPRRAGVLVPLPSQIESAAAKWRVLEAEVVFVAASPYGEQIELTRAAEELEGHPLDLVVMDCMGYTLAHRRVVTQATGRPVILASRVVARIVGELVE